MENIRTLRKKNGLTQAALAQMLHVHQTVVSKWEKGRTVPNIEQMKELSVLFDVPLEYIADVQVFPSLIGEENVSMTLGTTLKTLRKKHGYTQEELAKVLGTALSTISMYERDARVPDNATVKMIANLFHVDMNYIYGHPSVAAKRGIKIPVLGNVAAGIPLEAITDIEDYEEISEEMAASGEYVALKIHGDSMEPRMLEGDVVIVRVQETIESGETAIVMVDGGEATCKRIKKTPDGLMLISNNPAYEPMFYTRKQVEELPVRIFGKVVELRAKFR